MKEIGARLKAAREEKGLSLDEIQMVTKIRYKHLEALEAGDFDQLPGEVYVKGFLVNFAKNVGLDGEEILRQYYALKNQASPGEQETEAAETETIWTEAVTPKKVGPERVQGKTPLIALAVVGTLLVAGGIFWALREREPATQPVTVLTPEAATEGTGLEEPMLPGEEVGGEEPAVTIPEAPTSAETVSPPVTQPVLVVEADEVVWMGIYPRSTGALLFEGTLYPGERREWVLTEDVILRIGNAGGLRVNYRGEDLGKLGSSGQVVNKVITVD